VPLSSPATPPTSLAPSGPPGRAARATTLLGAGLSLLASLAACATNAGPRTIPGARFDYNERLSQSTNDQVLLNLVRLRYRDTPYFLEVGSVLVQYQITGRVAVTGSTAPAASPSATAGLEYDREVDERPTITYQPLTGDAFARRFLTPISAGTLALLAGSGWSIERVFDCCVDAVNDLTNVPSAAGPTPTTVSVDPRFHEMAVAFRTLQKTGRLEIIRYTDGDSVSAMRLLAGPGDTSSVVAAASARLRELLNVDGEHDLYVLGASGSRSSAQIRVRQRSLLGAMFFLSQAVDVPESDVAAGLVPKSVMTDGSPVDWGKITGEIFRVRVSESRPERSFVSVRYRGHWFYIDDADLESKTTFDLLTHLVSLQSVPPRGSSPLVTVPLGP
jgi:hypothetical protein